MVRSRLRIWHFMAAVAVLGLLMALVRNTQAGPILVCMLPPMGVYVLAFLFGLRVLKRIEPWTGEKVAWYVDLLAMLIAIWVILYAANSGTSSNV